VALVAIVARLAGQDPMATHKIGIVVGGDAFSFMAVVAILDRRMGVLRMGHLLVGVGPLLHADQAKAEKCWDQYKSLHVCVPPF
jgi:hypothetical protein